MFEWVLKPKIMSELGMTEDQVDSRRNKGFWTRGVHFKKFSDGVIWYNVTALKAWQDQESKAA